MGRTLSPKQTVSLLLDPKPLLKTNDELNPSSFGSPKSKGSQQQSTASGFIDKFSKTDSEAMAKLVKQRLQDK